jgi:hypothetical protein
MGLARPQCSDFRCARDSADLVASSESEREVGGDPGKSVSGTRAPASKSTV